MLTHEGVKVNERLNNTIYTMCTYFILFSPCVSLLKIKAYGLGTPHLFKYSTYMYISCIDRKFEYMSRLTVHTHLHMNWFFIKYLI